MAATITIIRGTGTASGGVAATNTTVTAGTNTRASSSDNPYTNETTNSILVPAAGTNYSYWVSTRLNCGAITGGTVDNLRWYTDGTNNLGTGVDVKVAPASGYIQATGTPGTTGTQLITGNHAGLNSTPSPAFLYNSSAPLAVTGTTSTTGQFGHWVVYQFEVATTAASGATAQETFTWKYDDTSS